VALIKPQKSTKGYDDLVRRNKSIAAMLLSKLQSNENQVDLILFHRGPLPASHKTHIKNRSGCDLVFIDIQNSPLNSEDVVDLQKPDLIGQNTANSREAKQNNHFWFVDALKFLSEYSHMLRLDEHYVLQGAADIFLDMQKQNLHFASCTFNAAEPEQIRALKEFTQFFCARLLRPTNDYNPAIVPETSCMLLDLDALRQNDHFNAFQLSVKATGMIYTHSWPEGALWAVFVHNFVEPARTNLMYPGLSFYHLKTGIVTHPLPNWNDGLQNAALNKPTSKNAEYWPPFDYIESSSQKVVQGTPTGTYTFMTVLAEQPYWQVDLETQHSVKAIEVHNRDVAESRALGLLFEISDDGKHFEILHKQSDLFFASKRYPLVIDFRLLSQNPAFRYLRLRLPKREHLCLDQVMIYSEA
jgi:hypothetical protein